MPDTPPMTPAAPTQTSQDSMITVLVILWYVYAGFNLLGICLGGLYLALGIGAFVSPESFQENDPNAPPPEFFAWLFSLLGGVVIVLSIAFGLLSFFCARNLSRRRGRTLCFVASAIACLNVPLGTALGVLTIISITKPDVRRQFDANAQE